MIFGSIEFFVFFIIVLTCWLVAPSRHRWAVLLIASYIFYYFWNPWFVLVLAFCTLVSWWSAIRLTSTDDTRHKKIIFWCAVGANLGPLLYFKYLVFVSNSIYSFSRLFGFELPVPQIEILLPIGISFFTLQAISYSADVYTGKIKPEPHLGIFALYLSFFPRLISGPIERGEHLLPQLKTNNNFNSQLFLSGAQLFFWGLFKKLVLADRMGMYVDMVFSHPGDSTGWSVILAVWLYTLQIYCDFSAYMDMAIGCARIFGIELSANFNFPYMARSIADFWRRWHITLTSWFRDYVYLPMGGNRVSSARWALNILIVFLISGLWHGAGWTFIIWGGLHGLFYLVGKATKSVQARFFEKIGLHGPALMVVQVLITFHLVAFAWIFFRANSIHDAWQIISHLPVNLSQYPRMLASQFSTYLSWMAGICFVFLELLRYWYASANMRIIHAAPVYFRYPLFVAVLLAISLLGLSSSQFIYFHF